MTAADTANTDENAAGELVDLCADLLAEARYEPFVARLLAGPAGHWRLLTDLVTGLDEIQAGIAALDRLLSSQTRVTWLPYPECAEGPGYATVMFFNESGMSRIWIYNRGHMSSVSSSPPR
jgi:hypothetical protein